MVNTRMSYEIMFNERMFKRITAYVNYIGLSLANRLDLIKSVNTITVELINNTKLLNNKGNLKTLYNLKALYDLNTKYVNEKIQFKWSRHYAFNFTDKYYIYDCCYDIFEYERLNIPIRYIINNIIYSFAHTVFDDSLMNGLDGFMNKLCSILCSDLKLK